MFKLFELNTKNQMNSFFKAQNLHNMGISDETVLCDFQREIVQAPDKKKVVICLFVDLLKAFDSCKYWKNMELKLMSRNLDNR